MGLRDGNLLWKVASIFTFDLTSILLQVRAIISGHKPAGWSPQIRGSYQTACQEQTKLLPSNYLAFRVDESHSGTEDNVLESSNEIEAVLSAGVPLIPSTHLGYPSANVVTAGSVAEPSPTTTGDRGRSFKETNRLRT